MLFDASKNLPGNLSMEEGSCEEIWNIWKARRS